MGPSAINSPLTRQVFVVRPASTEDIPELHAMIRALADFERLSHLCLVTQRDLEDALFGPHPAAEALIAWSDARAAGFALFHHSFSTFLGRRGLWLEDLFVWPPHRRKGCAQSLLRALAGIAVQRGCGRFEWTVLDWNAQAIDFYRSLGADILTDWRIVRMVGPALADLAASGERSP